MRATQSPGGVYFRMLGNLEVTGGGAPLRPDLVARPKALALLAFLALESRLGPCSRDTVLVHFWPDSSMASARHALRQALYELRQALGPGVIETRGRHDLGVNRELFSADALELLDALDAGRVQSALALYRGGLLPGLYFADAPPEFESWLDGAREELRGRLAEAVWEAQAEAEAAGEIDVAVRLGRRGLELDPFDEAGLRRLMELLRRSGRSGEAIHLFRRFRDRLRTELELSCSPETTALATRIAADLPAEQPATDPPPYRVTDVSTDRTLDEVPVVVSGEAPVDSSAGKGGARPPRKRRRPVASTVLGVALVLAVAVPLVAIMVLSPSEPLPEVTPAELARSRLAEPPVVGAPGSGALLVLGPVLSPDSDPMAGVAVASALNWVLAGHELPSGGRLSGRIVPTDRGWELDLALSRPGGVVRIATFVPGDLVAVVRQLADVMVAVLELPGRVRLSMLPANERALRAHVRGEWLLERGEVHAAAAAFQQAVGYDPGFALGYHYLSLAASIAFDTERAERAGLTALALQAQLPEVEALIVEARRAHSIGEPEKAEALLNSVLAMSPGHGEARYHAAEVLFHYNPLRGRPLAEARGALEQASTRAVSRPEALYHAAQVALLDGDLHAFDRASSALLDAAPAGLRSGSARALRARVLGSPEDWQRELGGLAGARDLVVFSTAHDLAVYHGDLPAALDVLEILTRPDREPGVRARAHAARADLLAAAGRPRQVAIQLRRATEIDPFVGGSRAAQLLALGVLPPDDGALYAIARYILQDQTRSPRTTSASIAVENRLEFWLDHHTRALAALAVGDPETARDLVRMLEGELADDPAARILRADLSLRLTQAGLAGPPGRYAFDMRGVAPREAVLSPLFSRPLARLVQARADRDQGRLRQADRWFASLMELSIPDLALSAVALGERARLARLRGDPVAAEALLDRLDRLQAGAEDGYLQWRQQQPWAPPAHASPGAQATGS